MPFALRWAIFPSAVMVVASASTSLRGSEPLHGDNMNTSSVVAPWDEQPHSFDLTEAQEAVLLANAAYQDDPMLPDGYKLYGQGVYTGGGLTSEWDRCFIASKPGVCAVAYRGSANMANWFSDAIFPWVDLKGENGDLLSYVELGFRNGYEHIRDADGKKFLSDLRDCLGDSNRLLTTGHSRGASIASLLAIQFARDESLDSGNFDGSRFRETSSSDLIEYTFGEPRVVCRGEVPIDDLLQPIHQIRKFRFIYEKDIVPSIPPNLSILSPYGHFGAAIHLIDNFDPERVDTDFPLSSSETMSLDNHHMVNYLTALGVVPPQVLAR